MNNELQKEAEKINRDCLTFPNAFMAKIENEISHINKRLDDIPTKSEMMLANEQLLVRALEKADVRYAGKSIGGNAIYGGAGGAGDSNEGGGSGGVSLYGGNGGNISSSGSPRGGGGGGRYQNSGSAGSGGRGEIIVREYFS